MKPVFSADEYSIMRCYAMAGMSRQRLMDDLTQCLPYVTEPTTSAMVDGILKKLEDLSDKDFARMDLLDGLIS